MTANVAHKIVIVDDSEEVRRSLAFMLRAARYDVECFASADEFFKRHEKLDGQLLLVDYVMPQMDGLALVSRLRGAGWKGRAILITGFYDVSLPRKAKSAGIDQILEKPLDSNLLLETIAAEQDQ